MFEVEKIYFHFYKIGLANFKPFYSVKFLFYTKMRILTIDKYMILGSLMKKFRSKYMKSSLF